tara:strand:+ start:432 stop:806 length:375 start_codon:yes stop_codon:yes gene_type:complete
MKKLSLPLTNHQYNLLERLAKAENRKLNDYLYLVFAEGLRFLHDEHNVYVKKLETEYTKEETDRIAKNAELEKTEGWNGLSHEEKEAKGWNYTNDYLEDNFIEKLEEEIRNLVIDDSPLKEEVE